MTIKSILTNGAFCSQLSVRQLLVIIIFNILPFKLSSESRQLTAKWKNDRKLLSTQYFHLKLSISIGTVRFQDSSLHSSVSIEMLTLSPLSFNSTQTETDDHLRRMLQTPQIDLSQLRKEKREGMEAGRYIGKIESKPQN